MSSKLTVVKSHLDVLAKRIRLEEAFLATLGGEGLEADLWRASGVRPDRAWLIDRSPRAVKQLMSDQGDFQLFYGALVKFPQAVAARYGRKAQLDFFHWDLCGTVDAELPGLKAVLPLLFRGVGRMLAVTTADARRNRALEQPDEVWSQAEALFGSERLGFIRSFLSAAYAGRPTPSFSVLRELSVICGVFNALPKPMHCPETMIRYFYMSRGFAMRSYLFVFPKRHCRDMDRFVGETWRQAPMLKVSGDRVNKINIPTVIGTVDERVSDVKKDDLSKSIDRLLAARVFMSPEFQADLDAVIKAATKGFTRIDKLIEVHGLLGGLLEDIAGKATPDSSVSRGAKASSAKAVKKTGRRSRRSKQQKANGELRELTVHEKDDIRLDLLKAGSGKKASLEKERVMKRLGLDKAKNGVFVLSKIIAHAHGSFRPNFFARLLQRDGVTPEKDAKSLASHYPELTPEQVLAEAKSSQLWRAN